LADFLRNIFTPSKTPLAGWSWSIESAGLAKTLGKGTRNNANKSDEILVSQYLNIQPNECIFGAQLRQSAKRDDCTENAG